MVNVVAVTAVLREGWLASASPERQRSSIGVVLGKTALDVDLRGVTLRMPNTFLTNGLRACWHALHPTIPVFVVSAMAAHPRHQKALDVVSAVPSLDFGTQTALSCRSALASPRDAHRINLFHNF
jgi:hypothetical protein